MKNMMNIAANYSMKVEGMLLKEDFERFVVSLVKFLVVLACHIVKAGAEMLPKIEWGIGFFFFLLITAAQTAKRESKVAYGKISSWVKRVWDVAQVKGHEFSGLMHTYLSFCNYLVTMMVSGATVGMTAVKATVNSGWNMRKEIKLETNMNDDEDWPL